MTRTVAILAIPEVQLLDVSGPLDVFAEANVQAEAAVYRPLIIASGPGPVRSSSGARLVPDHVVGETLDAPIDTLLVAGSSNAAAVRPDPNVVAWLRRTARTARRYGSVCAGAFLLAETGLLDGRRITTHWAVAQQLAQRYPSISVDADAIHVRDGRLRTAAGVTAGLDLALALVEEDLGRTIAMAVAGQLVMFFKRPGRPIRASGSTALGCRQSRRRSQRRQPGEANGPECSAFRPALSQRGRIDAGRLGRSNASLRSTAAAGGWPAHPQASSWAMWFRRRGHSATGFLP
jgi:transcriptional regulator GlxA family with amidase domain